MSLLILFLMISCHPAVQDDQNRSEEHGHNHDEEKGIQYTRYTDSFELFAESELWVIGRSNSVLAHFSKLPDFRALDSVPVSLTLEIGGSEISQKLEKPTKKGIYSFQITPSKVGNGRLIFNIGSVPESEIVVDQVTVFPSLEEAYHAAEEQPTITPNSIHFTKEMSWRIPFRTEYPRVGAFGKIIRAVGQVKTTQNDEMIISSRSNGILQFLHGNLIEGKMIQKGVPLFAISSKGFIDDDLSVRIAGAEIEWQKAEADHSRLEKLFADRIVTEAAYLESQQAVRNARLKLNNLRQNGAPDGQQIVSPGKGFVHRMFVQNGQYVEPGQALMSIIRNKKLVIQADVDLGNAADLPKIHAVTVNNMHRNEILEFTDLSHEVLTIGQHTNYDNFLVPVTLELEGEGNFIAGSFVELFLKTHDEGNAITLPNRALLEEQGKFFVFSQVHPELFEKKYVNTGATDGIRTVVKGISPDERIVTEGAIFVKLAQGVGALDAHAGHVH